MDARRALLSGDWQLMSRLLPDDASLSTFSGFVPFKGGECCIRVSGSLPSKAATLQVSEDVADAAVRHADQLRACAQQCHSLGEFIGELQGVISRGVVDSSVTSGAAPASRPEGFHRALITQLGDVGWAFVESYDSKAGVVTLFAEDDRRRRHVLLVQLPSDFPRGTLLVNAQFPEVFLTEHELTGVTLTSVYKEFCQRLARYVAFWDELDDIDARTWVLDPDPGPQRRSSAYRRIAIGSYAWLQVILTWSAPREACECRFVGADTVVEPLLAKYKSRLSMWSNARSVCDNLENILEMRLPARSGQAVGSDSIAVECGVCYAYKLPRGVVRAAGDSREEDFDVPTFRCEAARCGRAFHRLCLSEWLTAVPTTRRSFGVLFGDCPYCQETLCFPLTDAPIS